MIVPDETKYKKGERRVEHVPGFHLCLNCLECPITSQSQIKYDGFWYCMHFHVWKAGNDIVEYRCTGYKQKHCKFCANYRFCSVNKNYSTFCNRFRRKGIDVGSLYGGRVRQISPMASDGSFKTEQAYIDMKINKVKEAYSAIKKEQSTYYISDKWSES